MAHLPEQNLNESQTDSIPSVRPANLNASLTGTYFVRVREVNTICGGRSYAATVSRQVPFVTLGYQLITSARAATPAAALAEARRNVRLARKAGGL